MKIFKLLFLFFFLLVTPCYSASGHTDFLIIINNFEKLITSNIPGGYKISGYVTKENTYMIQDFPKKYDCIPINVHYMEQTNTYPAYLEIQCVETLW